MKLKIFFCQFPNPWALRVSGMGGYSSKCEKSKNHCTLMYSMSVCTGYSMATSSSYRDSRAESSSPKELPNILLNGQLLLLQRLFMPNLPWPAHPLQGTPGLTSSSSSISRAKSSSSKTGYSMAGSSSSVDYLPTPP
jgi:hypothetical protein